MTGKQIVEMVIKAQDEETMDGGTVARYAEMAAEAVDKIIAAAPEAVKKSGRAKAAHEAGYYTSLLIKQAWGGDVYYYTERDGHRAITALDAGTRKDIASLVEAWITTGDDLDAMIETARDLANTARERGYKPGWVFYRLRDRYGDRAANILTAEV